MMADNQSNGRRCFVTVGATAGFRQLLDEVTSPDFLHVLSSLGFGAMDIQCGPDINRVQQRLQEIPEGHTQGIRINPFAFTDKIKDYMLQCRSEKDVRLPGCIIAHAGMLPPPGDQSNALGTDMMLQAPAQSWKRCATPPLWWWSPIRLSWTTIKPSWQRSASASNGPYTASLGKQYALSISNSRPASSISATDTSPKQSPSQINSSTLVRSSICRRTRRLPFRYPRTSASPCSIGWR